MDGIRAILTSLIVIALIFIVVLVALHIFKPRVVAWIRSNGEEKISLSKNKLYHVNGYMVIEFIFIITIRFIWKNMIFILKLQFLFCIFHVNQIF